MAISNEDCSFEVVGVAFYRLRWCKEKEMSGKQMTTQPKSLRAKLRPEVDLGFNWGTLNTVLLALGVACLGAGYLSLSRGSITLAPVLLVFAYCGLIPAALLVRSKGQESGE